VRLPDAPELQQLRLDFDGSAAHRAPFVLKGANLSASTFWHGKLMQAWAERWVKYMTSGAGNYAICGMEDTGTMQSLTWLARAHKVDLDRVLVLRTASNFDVPKRGQTAAESLSQTKLARYTAFLPSLDTAYRVGRVVVDDIVSHWSERRDHLPSTTAN
jgi:purine nucleoside permease